MFYRTLIGACGLLLCAGACESSPESVATGEQALNGPDVDVTLVGGSETSTAFGISPAGQPTVVIGWNESTLNPGNPANVASWSQSTNGGMSFPTIRSEASFPWAVGAQRPTMSDGTPYSSTRSDPNVVATGWPGQYAYITTARSQGSVPNDIAMDIVVAVSQDNGMTFGPASNPLNTIFRVSDPASSGGNDGIFGNVDEPAAYVEGGGSHVVWVTWVNHNGGFGSGATQQWIRRLHFNANGQIDFTPMANAQEIRVDCNLNCVWFDQQNIAAFCDPAHAAVDNCAGGTETVVIGFPRVNNGVHGGDTNLIDNQCSVGNQNLDVEWRATISRNPAGTAPSEWRQGVSNVDGSFIMGHDPVWANCAVPGVWGCTNPPATGDPECGNNRGRMGLYHDDMLGKWHMYWTKETFNGPMGAATGLRVFHTSFDDNFINSSEEIDPIRNIAGVGCGTFPLECFANQIMPSASWSRGPSTSTHAVVWHDTRLDTITPRGVIWGSFSHSGGVLTSFTDMRVDQAGSPWAFSGINANTPWGDYEGMASDNNGTFFPAWGDNRLGGPQTQVFSRGWQP